MQQMKIGWNRRLDSDPTQKSEHRERLMHLFTEWLLTRVDAFNVTHRSYGILQNQSFLFRRSVGEEPTRLMSYIGKSRSGFQRNCYSGLHVEQ